MFLAMRRASALVLMFCAPGLFFGGVDGDGSRFYVLCSRTCFRRNRGCHVRFLCFALPDSFSAVPRASTPVFIFCALGLVLGCTEVVRCLFHVFGGADGVRSRFHVLRSRTYFLRYRGRQFPFSCFMRQDSFSTISRASGPIFMFCAP
jgi:hypothetical protein